MYLFRIKKESYLVGQSSVEEYLFHHSSEVTDQWGIRPGFPPLVSHSYGIVCMLGLVPTCTAFVVFKAPITHSAASAHYSGVPDRTHPFSSMVLRM